MVIHEIKKGNKCVGGNRSNPADVMLGRGLEETGNSKGKKDAIKRRKEEFVENKFLMDEVG